MPPPTTATSARTAASSGGVCGAGVAVCRYRLAMFSGERSACVAFAAYLPCSRRVVVNKEKPMRYGGLGGLIVLIADVWAIVNIFQSGASTGDKVLWTVIVIVLPILGFILWFFLGPRTGRPECTRRSGAQAHRTEQHRRLVAAVAQRRVDRRRAAVSRALGDATAGDWPPCPDETPSCRAPFADCPHDPESRRSASARARRRSRSRRSLVNADSWRLQRSTTASACGSSNLANARTSSRAPFRTRSSRSSHSIHDNELCILPFLKVVCRERTRLNGAPISAIILSAQSTFVGRASPLSPR